MTKKLLLPCWLLAYLWTCFLLVGCGQPPDPLEEIARQYGQEQNYSIILEDMKEEGIIFKDYFHKYQIVRPEAVTRTDWRPVSEEFYNQHLPFLGMTILAKKDGQEDAEVSPPGFEYVDDERYGRWEKEPKTGKSFWSFYGKYRLLADLLGGRSIFRDSHNQYLANKIAGRPYFGLNNEYGTHGSITKAAYPGFFSRPMPARLAEGAVPSGTLTNKTGRTTSASVRGRSGGVGK